LARKGHAQTKRAN
jgi:sarcosine oxidase delta subunit